MDTNALNGGDQMDDRRHEVSPLVAELALLLVLAYILSFWLALNGSALREGVLFGALAIAGCSAAFAVRRALGSIRAVWWTVPFVCLLLAAGEGGRLVAGHLNASVGSRWLVSGVLVLGAYSLLILGALRALAGSSAIAWSLGLIDSAMIGLAASAPWLGLVVLPRLSDHGGDVLLPQLVAPVVAAVALLMIALSARLRWRRGLRPSCSWRPSAPGSRKASSFPASCSRMGASRPFRVPRRE